MRRRCYTFPERLTFLTVWWTTGLEDNRNANANARRGSQRLPSRLANGLHVADYARIQKPRTHAALVTRTRASHLMP